MGVGNSPLKDRMIFVVGSRRSGTNWLQRIITTHPSVMGVQSESALFMLGIEPLMERFHQSAIDSPRLASLYVPRPALLDAVRDFCDAVFAANRDAAHPRADRIVERTPDHVRHLSLIGEIYPDARFVHIIRDGRDVARSLRDQPWGPATLSEAAEEWRSAIEAARSVAANLRHYKEVRYEEVFDNTRAVITDLFDWLALSHTDALLETVLGEAAAPFNVDTAESRIATQKWKQSLSTEEQRDFDRIAGATLHELGYETTRALAALRPGLSVENVTARTRTRDRRLRREAWLRRETRSRLHRTQEVSDRFLDLVHQRRFDDVAGVLTPNIVIQIRGGGAWEARGLDAIAKFRTSFAADPALSGHQTVGNVHVGPGIAFVLTSYRTDDGRSHDRAFVLWVSDELIERVIYYVLPLGSD